MDRQELEQHQATLRGLRDTIASNRESLLTDDPMVRQRNTIFDVVEGVAGVVQALIDEKILGGEHAHAVSEAIKREGMPVTGLNRETARDQRVGADAPEPRMTLDRRSSDQGDGHARQDADPRD